MDLLIDASTTKAAAEAFFTGDFFGVGGCGDGGANFLWTLLGFSSQSWTPFLLDFEEKIDKSRRKGKGRVVN